MRWRGLLLALLALLAAGCSGRRAAPERAAAPDAARPTVPVLRYEPCARAGARKDAPRPVRWGELQLLPSGEILQPARSQPAPSRLILAALGDTKEALPATLEQLRRLGGRLRAEGASAVVVLGGIDQSFEGTRAVLQALPAIPVVGLPGDRESRSGWQAALEALEARGADLSRARAVVVPGASLIGVPGYHLPHHLLAREQGCSYSGEDVRGLARIARRLPQPRVLLAHGPPRGEGAAAIDRAFGQVNIGDPHLSELMRDGEIRFGLFAHVHESGGRATTRRGRPVAEGQWSEELLLNVGSADSVPHEDLGGRWSRGSAAIVEIAGTRARYHMLRLDEGGE